MSERICPKCELKVLSSCGGDCPIPARPAQPKEAGQARELPPLAWLIEGPAGWKTTTHEAQTMRKFTAEKGYKVTPLVAQAAPALDKDRYFPFEFEVWQGEVMCASTSGPREMALAEVMRYAAHYEQDGPVKVFEVRRELISAAAKGEK